MKKNIILTILTLLNLILLFFVIACNNPEEINNTPPRIVRLQVNSYPVIVNEVVAIECFSEDDDGDDLIYKIEVTGGTISSSVDSTFWSTPKKYGEYLLSCTVDDGYGGMDSATITSQVNSSRIIGTWEWYLTCGGLHGGCVSADTLPDTWIMKFYEDSLLENYRNDSLVISSKYSLGMDITIFSSDSLPVLYWENSITNVYSFPTDSTLLLGENVVDGFGYYFVRRDSATYDLFP